jgi:hypothetical protein
MDKPPKIDKISFEIFHDLMHRPFTRECRAMYGGSRRHLALWWEFQAVPAILTATLCRIGRHCWGDGWSRTLGDTWVCRGCWTSKEK